MRNIENQNSDQQTVVIHVEIWSGIVCFFVTSGSEILKR